MTYEDLEEARDKKWEAVVRQKTAEEFAQTIKKQIFRNLAWKCTGTVRKNEIDYCTTMAAQMLYTINRILNEHYGCNYPLNACNQFKCEPELTAWLKEKAQEYRVEIDL